VNKLTYLYCYYGGVDWQKTRAYFCSGTGEGLLINSKKRFASGIVPDSDYETLRENIIRGLLEIKDDETGQSVIENAYKREDIFSGEYTKDSPDIILKLRDGYATNESVEASRVLEGSPADEMLVAEHRLEGIFIASGPQIKSGIKCDTASILDIAPSIFALLGLPAPSSFDGKVLHQIFKDDTIEGPKIDSFEGVRKQLGNRINVLKKKGKI